MQYPATLDFCVNIGICDAEYLLQEQQEKRDYKRDFILDLLIRICIYWLFIRAKF